MIDFVRDHARVPVIETGAGVCHAYFDRSGDTEKGAAIAAAEFLQTNFPDRTGFSPRNVRQMRWQEMSESGIWSRRYAVDGQKHSY